MGLRIKQPWWLKTQGIITLIAVFALAIQPVGGFVSGLVANAVSDSALYVASNGDDNADCSYAAPCETIRHAIDSSKAGDKIIVMAGNYRLPVTFIPHDLTIEGEGMDVTTILQEGSTGSGKGWLQVQPGVEFSINNLTLNGNVQQTYYAIDHHGVGAEIDKVHFQNIRYGQYRGYGLNTGKGEGTFNVTNSVFTNIGRSGVIYEGKNVNGTFSGNTYTGKGAGEILDYAVDVWYGANVLIINNTVSNNLGRSTDGYDSAAFSIWDDSTATITSNTITGNTLGIVALHDSKVTANHNDISGNIKHGVEVSGSGVVMNAEQNWWGDMTGPSGVAKGAGDSVTNGVSYSPWLCQSSKVRLTTIDDSPSCIRPVVTSVTPNKEGYISGEDQKIYINIANPEVVRGGFLQLKKANETGEPAGSDKINYELTKDSEGKWYTTVDTTKLDDGAKYLFKVEAHGIQIPWGYYGNNSAWQYPNFHFIVDNTAPDKVNDVRVEQDGKTISITNKKRITVHWGESGADDFHHYEYQATSDKIDIWTDTKEYKTNKRTGDINGADGDRFYRVRAVDNAGNTGEWSDWAQVTLDTTSPEATVKVSPLSNGFARGVITVTGEVNSSEQNMQKHWFEITGPDGYNSVVSGGSNKGGHSYSFDWNTSGLNGEFKIRYVATDKAGNRNDCFKSPVEGCESKPATLQVKVDNTAPDIPIITPGGRDIKNSQVFSVASKDSTGPVVIDVVATATFNGQPVDIKALWQKNADGTYTFNTTSLMRGTKLTIIATATDRAGNTSSKSETYTVENDTPMVEIVSLRDRGDGMFVLSGTSGFAAGADVSVKFNGQEVTGTTQPGGAWSIVVGELAAETQYNFYVTIKNFLGYSSTVGPYPHLIPPVEGSGVDGVSAASAVFIPGETEDVQIAGTESSEPTVLGDEDSRVQGDSTAKNTAAITPSEEGWKLFGTAWYWWLAALAAIGAFLWWLAAAIRRRQTQEI